MIGSIYVVMSTVGNILLLMLLHQYCSISLLSIQYLARPPQDSRWWAEAEYWTQFGNILRMFWGAGRQPSPRSEQWNIRLNTQHGHNPASPLCKIFSIENNSCPRWLDIMEIYFIMYNISYLYHILCYTWF